MRKTYRLVILNDATFEERWALRLTPMNIFIWLGSATLLIITGTVLLIAYTPLREFIPGYPDGRERQALIDTYQEMDSLEQRLAANDAYVQRIQKILNGQTIADTLPQDVKETDKNVQFEESEVEKDFKEQMEEKEKYAVSVNSSENTASAPVNNPGLDVFFFVPAKGEISRSFSLAKNHPGVDISAVANDPVHAALDGTVIFSGWTVDGGHELHIQHSHDLVTIYKHNSILLKKSGDRIRPGDVIAFVGNTGRLSEGMHLHFEIWHNGVPVDPEKYIVF